MPRRSALDGSMSRGARALLLAVTLGAASVQAPRAARAAPSAADVDSARESMRLAREERAKGNHAAALERFAAAHKIMGLPTTGLEVGQSQADLGLLVEARETWLAVTRMPVEPKEPAPFAAARQRAQQLADELTPRIPVVRFTIRGVQARADLKVTIDGAAVEPDLLLAPRRFDPGTHLAVFTEGPRSRRLKFTLAERDAKELEVDLGEPDAAAEPTADPTPQPDAPARKPADDAGASLRAPLAYGGFGVAAVSVVVGSVTGLVSLHHGSAAKDLCTGSLCPPSARGDLDSARSWATASNVSFAVAGAGAVVGVIGLLLPGAEVVAPTQSRRAPGASLYFGVGSVGVVGAF